jgi:hypothetical protein
VQLALYDYEHRITSHDNFKLQRNAALAEWGQLCTAMYSCNAETCLHLSDSTGPKVYNK